MVLLISNAGTTKILSGGESMVDAFLILIKAFSFCPKTSWILFFTFAWITENTNHFSHTLKKSSSNKVIIYLVNFKWNLLEFDLNLAKTLFKNVKRGPEGQRKCTVHISYVYNRGVHWSLLAPFLWVWHLWVVCVLILSFKLLFIHFFLFYCFYFYRLPYMLV